MGAWGIHFDESDGSLDFLGDVEENRDWNEIDHRVRDYVENGGYDDAEEVIAALELVAAALGRPSPRLTSELASWAMEHADDASRIREVSAAAATLVLNGSELSELWAEADEGEDWKATVADLTARLQA